MAQTGARGGPPPLQIGNADLKNHVALRTNEFAYMRAKGNRLVGRYVVMSLVPAPDNESRLGIVVSKKYDTRAVRRNRARRLIRECFRLLHNGFQTPTWVVMIARNHLRHCKLQDLQAEVVAMLDQQGILNQVDIL